MTERMILAPLCNRPPGSLPLKIFNPSPRFLRFPSKTEISLSQALLVTFFLILNSPWVLSKHFFSVSQNETRNGCKNILQQLTGKGPDESLWSQDEILTVLTGIRYKYIITV